VFDYDGVLTNVYLESGQELMIYDNGSIVWLHEGEVLAEGKLSGPIQHARWDIENEAWRMAGWREEIHLSKDGFERKHLEEIPVHVMIRKNNAYLLLNSGEWMLSNF